MFGVSGLALLVVSVIMMASGAQPSRAQTVGPAQVSAQAGRHQVGRTPSRSTRTTCPAGPWRCVYAATSDEPPAEHDRRRALLRDCVERAVAP
ncbi:MAG: hypothetical protein ACRDNF_22550 [Streptosporangiaceae bacterium]